MNSLRRGPMGKKCVRMATVAKRRGRCEPRVVTFEPAPVVLGVEVVEEPAADVVVEEKPKKKKKKASKKKSDS
jgi:hypothetical protein